MYCESNVLNEAMCVWMIWVNDNCEKYFYWRVNNCVCCTNKHWMFTKKNSTWTLDVHEKKIQHEHWMFKKNSTWKKKSRVQIEHYPEPCHRFRCLPKKIKHWYLTNKRIQIIKFTGQIIDTMQIIQNDHTKKRKKSRALLSYNVTNK